MTKKKETASFLPDLMVTPDEPEKKADAPDQLAQLLSKIDAMGGEMAELKRTNMALMTQPTYQSPPVLQQETDPKEMPDITLEPEKYASELQARVMKALGNREAITQFANQQRAEQLSQTQILWEDFQKTHPDYAKNKDLAEFAATKVAEDAAKRRIDVNKYMFSNSPQFMKDVVTYMDNKLGFKPVAEEANTTDDDEPENRTVGIFGGMEGGGKPAPTQEIPDNDLFVDIRSWQQKSGYHR